MAGAGRENADDLIAAALAAGKTREDAAVDAGVSPRTVYRRLEDPAFRQQVERLRADLVQTAAGRLADAMSGAADTLKALLGAKSEAVRLGASRAVLEMGIKVRESADLAERVSELERLLASKEEEPQIVPFVGDDEDDDAPPELVKP